MKEIFEKLDKKYSDKWDNHLAFHKRKDQQHITCESYSKNIRVKLGKEVNNKLRIYLDLKYWIYIRDAYCGNAQKQIHNDIAHYLYRLVELGYVICPANSTVLDEVFKQNDSQSRTHTCKIIDDLSGGIIIEPYILLVDIELMHLISSFLEKKDKIHELNMLVWNKAGNIYGQQIPYFKDLDKNTDNTLQKTFLDIFSDLTFSEIAKLFAEKNIINNYETDEYENQRTIETDKHKNDFKTYQQVLEIELQGFLDVMKDGIFEILNYLSLKKTKISFPKENTKYFMIYIFDLFRKGKLQTEFPQLHIQSGIHATIRHKNIPFKKGDFSDHLHASSAIPYCNLFFTERKLTNLLTQPPLNFDKTYNCKILYKEIEVLEELRKLCSTFHI